MTRVEVARSSSKKLTRQERFKLQRQRLVDAAAEVIGEVGYKDATINRITEKASVAYGTFYRHFESQQDIFDTVLPEKGREILLFIGEQVSGCSDPIQMERMGLLAFQAYIQANPGFFRLLYEGRLMAPKAHSIHINNLLNAYVRSMRRWQKSGYYKNLNYDELRAIATVFIGARDYLFMESWGNEKEIKPLPKVAIEAYLSLVRGVV